MKEISFTKPRIVVSQCLEFEACRYNSQRIPDSFIRSLIPHVNFLQICPEVQSGLGIPRNPIRLADFDGESRVLQPAAEKDVTPQVQSFLNQWFAEQREVDGFILKNRSPSCGIASVKIYKGNSSNTKARGQGFFAEAATRQYPLIPMEDEGRLRNFLLRERFLTAIYALSSFRNALERQTVGVLMDYHSRNKLLFMGWNQSRMRKMGSLLANHTKSSFEEISLEYRNHLLELLQTPAKPGSIINVLLHAFGGFKEKLEPREKQFFLNSLEEYRDERVPLSVPSYLLLQWAERFDNEYLMEQSFFHPFPPELVNIGDSGKGRDL